MAKSKREPAVWSKAQDAELKTFVDLGLNPTELELKIGRSKRDIRERCAELEIEVKASILAPIRRAGKKRTVLLREDHGGQIGVRWLCAHRSGPKFDTERCEALVAAGILVPAAGRVGGDMFQWGLAKA